MVKLLQLLSSNCFLRAILNLKHYSDRISDRPSGSFYGINILTFLSGIPSGIYIYTHVIIIIILFVFYYYYFFIIFIFIIVIFYIFGILSGIYSDILSGMLFDILFSHSILHVFRHSFWIFFLPSILTFSLTFFLAFFLAFYLTFSLASGWGPAVPTEIWSSRLRTKRRRGGEEKKRRRGKSMIQSRDPHLAGGAKPDYSNLQDFFSHINLQKLFSTD